MVSSKVLIEHGIGVLTIDASHALAFNEGLLHYYNTGDKVQLKQALGACIKTMEREPKRSVQERLDEAGEKFPQKTTWHSADNPKER